MCIFDPANGVCRRGRGAIGFEGVGVWWKSFCHQFDKFGCIFKFLTQFLTDQKHGQSLEALHGTQILRFNCETKLTKQCKSYPKIHGQTGGGQSQPLNTPLNPPAPVCAPWWGDGGMPPKTFHLVPYCRCVWVDMIGLMKVPLKTTYNESRR